MNNDLHNLRRILKNCRTIAVVGLSADWHRPSFFAAKYMQSHGYTIVPVNPRYAGQTGHLLRQLARHSPPGGHGGRISAL